MKPDRTPSAIPRLTAREIETIRAGGGHVCTLRTLADHERPHRCGVGEVRCDAPYEPTDGRRFCPYYR